LALAAESLEPLAGLGWTNGAAAWATLTRRSGDTLGSLMTPNKNSSGEISGLWAAAAIAALLSAVFLFGVPRRRPPRLSPGFDPLGIATFATFWHYWQAHCITAKLTNLNGTPAIEPLSFFVRS
jgi:hypothetical protein